MDFIHLAIGGGYCILLTAAILSCAQVGCVPVPPLVLSERFLVVVMALRRLAEEFRKFRDVLGMCAR